MGSIKNLYFIEKHRKLVHGPILEIGSKDYGSTQNFRAMFPNLKYLGVDLEKGKGVDLVLDMTRDFKDIKKIIKGKRFKTIICLSVLEHCRFPFKLAENIYKLLDKNGILFVSAPFSWKIHAYPDDYWRFTPSGIKTLFPKLDFEKYQGNVTSEAFAKEIKLNDRFFRAELTIVKGLRKKYYGPFTGIFIYICRIFRIFPSVFAHPYLYPPVLISMIGYKNK